MTNNVHLKRYITFIWQVKDSVLAGHLEATHNICKVNLTLILLADEYNSLVPTTKLNK